MWQKIEGNKQWQRNANEGSGVRKRKWEKKGKQSVRTCIDSEKILFNKNHKLPTVLLKTQVSRWCHRWKDRYSWVLVSSFWKHSSKLKSNRATQSSYIYRFVVKSNDLMAYERGQGKVYSLLVKPVFYFR